MPVRTESRPAQGYDVTVRRDVRIPTGVRGVTLSGDLFLPEGKSPVPLLLTVLPYRRDITALNGSPAERWFASRGYASLLLDLRGTGSSDGTQRPPFDPGEAEDALAAIEWAAQQPWCDGNVGMWGGSYGALTAMRAASHRPPGLRAIIAVEGPTDPGRDFVHPGGSRGAFSPLGTWALGTLFNQLLPPLDDYADPAEQTRWRRRFTAPPYLLDLWRNGPGSPSWPEREVDLAAIEVPALCVAGWRDLFVDGTIRAFERMSGPKRLVAGPWMHVMPQECPFTPIDFLALAQSWWDRWLLGEDTGPEAPPVSVYVQGARPRWLGFPSWPPPGTTRVEDLATWQRSEPADTDAAVGLLSGLWSTPAGMFGLPLDQHDDDARSLCHTSAPLAEALLVSGKPRVVVSAGWPRVSVKLTDVDPAGRSTLICAGLESGKDGADRIEVELTPTTYEIPAGHRLRVAVAPGDFPRVWPETPPGTGFPSVRTLSLPVVPSGSGSTIDYPLPDAGAAAAAPMSEQEPSEQAAWEITTDLLNDRVSLRLASSNAVRPEDVADRDHALAIAQTLVATADRADPAASAVTGSITATIDTETGAHLTVDVGVTATSSSVDATGRVTLDGETLLDRHWRG
ncbi:CocE/NonD family hydrolase [Amycolatopsis sp. NPDC059021]|uniref:CocE/NonD family hydrolase n=1 Tax=Amycolatopsis sp. NPDC059021 TaxID=3346704 RepID=UPI003670CC41